MLSVNVVIGRLKANHGSFNILPLVESNKLNFNVDRPTIDLIIIGTKQQRHKIVDYFSDKILANLVMMQ